MALIWRLTALGTDRKCVSRHASACRKSGLLQKQQGEGKKEKKEGLGALRKGPGMALTQADERDGAGSPPDDERQWRRPQRRRPISRLISLNTGPHIGCPASERLSENAGSRSRMLRNTLAQSSWRSLVSG